MDASIMSMRMDGKDESEIQFSAWKTSMQIMSKEWVSLLHLPLHQTICIDISSEKKNNISEKYHQSNSHTHTQRNFN